MLCVNENSIFFLEFPMFFVTEKKIVIKMRVIFPRWKKSRRLTFVHWKTSSNVEMLEKGIENISPRQFQCQHRWFYYFRKWYRERCISTNALEFVDLVLLVFFFSWSHSAISIIIIMSFSFFTSAIFNSCSHATNSRFVVICLFVWFSPTLWPFDSHIFSHYLSDFSATFSYLTCFFLFPEYKMIQWNRRRWSNQLHIKDRFVLVQRIYNKTMKKKNTETHTQEDYWPMNLEYNARATHKWTNRLSANCCRVSHLISCENISVAWY